MAKDKNSGFKQPKADDFPPVFLARLRTAKPSESIVAIVQYPHKTKG